MDEMTNRATVSQTYLRDRIRAWLAQGLLPAIDATAWAGPGTGQPCAVCRGVVEIGETEYEISCAGGHLFAHRDCYTIWHEESRSLPRASAGP